MNAVWAMFILSLLSNKSFSSTYWHWKRNKKVLPGLHVKFVYNRAICALAVREFFANLVPCLVTLIKYCCLRCSSKFAPAVFVSSLGGVDRWWVADEKKEKRSLKGKPSRCWCYYFSLSWSNLSLSSTLLEWVIQWHWKCIKVGNNAQYNV